MHFLAHPNTVDASIFRLESSEEFTTFLGEQEVKKDSQFLHVICSWTFGCGSSGLAHFAHGLGIALGLPWHFLGMASRDWFVSFKLAFCFWDV